MARVRFIPADRAGYGSQRAASGERPSVSKTELALDAEGSYVRPRRALTLLEKLALRAGGEAAKAVAMPVQQPVKRGRGRPKKVRDEGGA